MLHNTLACDVQGLPLGLVDQRFIDRPELGVSDKAAHGMESARWADIVGEMGALDLGDTCAVHVMEREGDAYAVFRQADAVVDGRSWPSNAGRRICRTHCAGC